MCRVCVKCGSTTTMQVQALLQAPGSSYHNIRLSDSDVECLSVDWRTADFICHNPDCRYVDDGFGKLVKDLRSEIQELKRQLADKNS